MEILLINRILINRRMENKIILLTVHPQQLEILILIALVAVIMNYLKSQLIVVRNNNLQKNQSLKLTMK